MITPRERMAQLLAQEKQFITNKVIDEDMDNESHLMDQEECQSCKSTRIMHINAKCKDLCTASIIVDGVENEHDGYPPFDIEDVCDDDYICMSFCLQCGQIQGDFPVDTTRLERNKPYSGVKDDDDDDD